MIFLWCSCGWRFLEKKQIRLEQKNQRRDGPALNPQTMVEDTVLCTGTPGRDGVQVKAWQLKKVSYVEGALASVCGFGVGGLLVAPKCVKTPKEAQDIVTVGSEKQSGNWGTIFELHFELLDPERVDVGH